MSAQADGGHQELYMRDLQGIAEINGPDRAMLQAARAQTVRDATAKAVDPAIIRRQHGERIDAVEQSPFLTYWRALNASQLAAGKPDVLYREAREMFDSWAAPDAPPAGAITFCENGEFVRAVPAPAVDGKLAWYGEFREPEGTWHRIASGYGPIIYTSAEYALIAARTTHELRVF